jgi:signal transduction histidine kinase
MTIAKPRVLVVDDEPDINLTFKTGLEANGFIVDAFSDPVNLREMTLNTIADSRNEIKKEYNDNIVLEFECKNDIFIEADRGRLNQVVSNLLNNAIKFTKEGHGGGRQQNRKTFMLLLV